MPIKGLSPVQRTLRILRQRGFLVDIVERFSPYAGKYGKRIDTFHFIDLLCIAENKIIAIQSCGSDFRKHDKKIIENEYAVEWLKAGGAIELWGWRKVVKHRGLKQKVWSPRVKVYLLDNFK